MTIRSFSSIYEPQATSDLPIEIPFMLFEYFNLKDLVIIERVCKTWSQISIEHNNVWKSIAYKKMIPVDPFTPLRVQVLHSFTYYCKDARIIFPEPLKNIPCGKSPAFERVLIDAELENHRASTAPRISITTLLKNPDREPPLQDDDDLDERARKSIERINLATPLFIAMLQIGVETKATFDRTFFEYLKYSDFDYGSRIITQCFEKRHFNKNFASPCSSENARQSLAHLKLMDDANEASLPFIHYLFQVTKKHSLTLQFSYYKSWAYSELTKALAPLQIVLFEKKDILNPLLENLSGNEWIKTFEDFLLGEGVELELKIKYPKQFQAIIETLDDKVIKECIHSMLLTIPDSCSTKDLYILQKINRSLTLSIIDILNNR